MATEANKANEFESEFRKIVDGLNIDEMTSAQIRQLASDNYATNFSKGTDFMEWVKAKKKPTGIPAGKLLIFLFVGLWLPGSYVCLLECSRVECTCVYVCFHAGRRARKGLPHALCTCGGMLPSRVHSSFK